MAFKLPNWSELSKVQRETLELAWDKSWVIPGSPGTGKSVLALYRAIELVGKGKKVLFLVFNKTLQQYIESAVDSLKKQARYERYNFNKLAAFTYHYYFGRLCNHEPPLLPGGNSFAYDFCAIKNYIKEGYLNILYDYIIIDEAQDFPIELIEALRETKIPLTCFIDDNQRIFGEKTNRDLVLSILENESKYFLDTNYRNPKEIVALSKLFYSGDELRLADSERSGDLPEFYHIDKSDRTEEIANIIENNSSKKIGIFVDREQMLDFKKDLEFRKVDYEYYYTNKDFNISFETDKPKILTYGTMKGLEFDIVIIPYYETLKKETEFYVGITRTGDSLYCFYKNETSALRKIKEAEDLVRFFDITDSDEDTSKTPSNKVSWAEIGDEINGFNFDDEIPF